jgi:hypothetical protein
MATCISYLIRLDELQEWEEREWLVLNLGKVSDFLDSTGQWKSNWKSDRLPNLGPTSYKWESDEAADEAIASVANWAFEVMTLLDMDPPVDWENAETSPWTCTHDVTGPKRFYRAFLTPR